MPTVSPTPTVSASVPEAGGDEKSGVLPEGPFGTETNITANAATHLDLTNPASNEDKHGHKHGPGLDSTTEKPKRMVTGLKWFFAYSSLLSTVLLFALDNTIVADLQPAIVNDFQTAQNLAWIGVSFMLGNVAILPLGKAYGVFNMKWLFIVCILLFEIGSAICGAANNMTALIVGRVIAGIGGCGIYVGGLNFVSVITNDHERPLYLSGIMAIWGIGCVLGPVIGGSFAQSNATWRWGFYINLPIAAVFAPAYLFCLPSIDAMPDKTFVEKLRTQDWIGILIFMAGCACYSMGLNFGGTQYDWNSGSEITLLVMIGVLFLAFVAVTIFHPGVSVEDKLLPIQVINSLEMLIVPLQAFLVAGSMFVAIYYTPLLFQFTRGDGPLEGGVRILPLVSMIVFFCVLSGALLPKLGYYIPWYVFGNAMILAGSALMLTMDTSTSTSKVYGYTVMIGIGVGCFQSSGVAVMSSIAPPSQINNAVSIMTIAQVLGILTALSVSGSVFQNISVEKIGNVLTNSTRDDILQLTTGTSSSLLQDLDMALKAQVTEQITIAIRDTFGYVVGVSALGFITSFFLGREKLYHAGGAVGL